MLKIKENTVVYVACPGRLKTGGPELLHQLVYKLNKLGVNAQMYYYKPNQKNPVPVEFEKYNNKYTNKIVDNENNVLIIPETRTEMLYRYKNIRKVIWWLSIDNFYKRNRERMENKFRKIRKFFGLFRLYNFEKDSSIFHFCQCYYAVEHLKEKGITENIAYLSDYLNSAFIEKQDNKMVEKINAVMYNPLKGVEFTKKIIENAEDIEFKPIRNMTTVQVAEALNKNKVYIDFGEHPGKDRIPREAAISGCCIITGKKGSAGNNKDIFIPEEFKIEDKDENINKIILKIRECINNYEVENKKFEEYREKIRNEEKIFEEDIKTIFEL